MELAFAFLAQNADTTSDGNLWAAGVDFDRLRCSDLPASIQFCIVTKVRFGAGESSDHSIRIELTKPDGTREKVNEASMPFQALMRDNDPRQRAGAIIIISIGMTFAAAGEYLIHVVVDEADAKSLSLLVEPQGKPST